jgi:hypothetical protein
MSRQNVLRPEDPSETSSATKLDVWLCSRPRTTPPTSTSEQPDAVPRSSLSTVPRRGVIAYGLRHVRRMRSPAKSQMAITIAGRGASQSESARPYLIEGRRSVGHVLVNFDGGSAADSQRDAGRAGFQIDGGDDAADRGRDGRPNNAGKTGERRAFDSQRAARGDASGEQVSAASGDVGERRAGAAADHRDICGKSSGDGRRLRVRPRGTLASPYTDLAQRLPTLTIDSCAANEIVPGCERSRSRRVRSRSRKQMFVVAAKASTLT